MNEDIFIKKGLSDLERRFFFMSGGFFKPFYSILITLIAFIFLLSCLFSYPLLVNGYIPSQENTFYDEFTISPSGFAWPTPGYTKINSYFGKRTSPTAGASSYHKGIDIGAPQGSQFIAVIDGQITYVGFLGGGGYTITLTSGDLKITYCHVSPNYLVSVGDTVVQGQVIGHVGPKYVYGVPRKYLP